MGEGQTPADLHTRREISLELGKSSPTYPTNGATSGTSTAHSPKPRSANCGMIRSSTKASDCAWVRGDGLVLHHTRVGVQRCERCEIVRHPFPQQHPLALQARHSTTHLEPALIHAEPARSDGDVVKQIRTDMGAPTLLEEPDDGMELWPVSSFELAT